MGLGYRGYLDTRGHLNHEVRTFSRDLRSWRLAMFVENYTVLLRNCVEYHENALYVDVDLMPSPPPVSQDAIAPYSPSRGKNSEFVEMRQRDPLRSRYGRTPSIILREQGNSLV